MDLAQIWARYKSLAFSLTRTQQITLAATFVGVVGLVGGAAYWLQAANYRLLFSDLEPEAAVEVVNRLKEQGVGYRLEDGGRTVRVDEDRLDELRLDFAGNGLPSSGRIGFEIFDRTTFGATDFQEQVSYRRALEGEIARTIASLAEVAEARVHIALAKDSLFIDDRQAAKASITLKMRQNRPLLPSTARAIATLVASSVEGLEPDSIVIVDTAGRALNAPRRDDAEAAMVEGDQRIERDLTTQLITLLEPVVGVGGVRVNVAADLTRHTQEQTEERWDPNPVVRSRQVSSVTDSSQSAGRVAGARSNTPGVTPADSDGATMVNGRGSETTNYEIGKTVTRSVRPGGEVARLSVAVVIDDERVARRDEDGNVTYTSRRRDAGQLRKIQNLVAAAVGFNPGRGDQLTVENISFEEVTLEERINVPPPVWKEYVPLAMTTARWGAIVLVALFALFFVVRPAVHAVLPSPVQAVLPPALPDELPRTVQELQDELDARLDTVDPERTFRVRANTEVSRRVAAIAKGNPEDTARLLRSWLVEDAR